MSFKDALKNVGIAITVVLLALAGIFFGINNTKDVEVGGSSTVNYCVTDRTYCGDVFGSVDCLCFPTNPQTFTNNQPNISSIYGRNIGDESFKYHYHGGDWHFSNPDDLSTSGSGVNGGFGRVRYRSYGILFNGAQIGGGSQYNKTVLPYGVMAAQDRSSIMVTQSEYEILGDRRYLVMAAGIKCNSGSNCDGTAANRIGYSITNIYGSPTPAYRTDIAGSYCGFEYNITKFATSYDPAFTERTFYQVMSRCPDTTSVAAGAAYFNYTIAAGAKINLSIIVTTKEFESGIPDWIENYTAKRAALVSEYENASKEIYFPTGRSNAEAVNYYWGLYTMMATTFRNWNDSDTTNNYYAFGSSQEVVTPNIEGYYGMWPWDAPNLFNNMIPAVNWSRTESSYLKNLMVGSLKVLVNESSKYPTVDSFKPIFTYGTGSSQDGTEWFLTVLNAYNQGAINASFMCNDTLPVLKSMWYETKDTYKSSSSWRCNNAQGQEGRDGSDTQATNSGGSLYNTQCTGLFGVGARALSIMYGICGNYSEATYFDSAYTNITTDSASFWNSSANIYWNRNTGDSGFYTEDDASTAAQQAASWAAEPFGNCLMIAMNVSDQTKINSILTNFNQNFSSTYGLSSIPRQHVCFTQNAAPVGSCFAGETWDGPIWMPDNTYCIAALRYAQYNLSYSVASNITWLENLTANVSKNANTVWGSESYDANDVTVDDSNIWGSNPYGWGNYLLMVYNNYSIFSPLAQNPTLSDPTTPTTENLTLYVPFDEAFVTTAEDHTTTQNNMTLMGDAYFGPGGLILDGNGDYANTSMNIGELNLSVDSSSAASDISMSVVFNLNTNTTAVNNQNLIYGQTAGGSSYLLSITTTGKVHAEFTGCGGRTSTYSVGNGTEHHVAVTYDRSAETVVLYYDGAVMAGSGGCYTHTAGTVTSVNVGETSGNQYVNGSMRNLRIYIGKVLSSTEVTNIYTADIVPFDTSYTASVPYYNVTHPRLFTNTPAQVRTNVNATSSKYKTQYGYLKTSAEGTGAFSTYCGSTPDSCSWRGYRPLYEAVYWYISNDSTSRSDALSGLTGYLNYSSSDYASESIHDTIEILVNLAYTYDIMYSELTTAQREEYINKYYNIVTAMHDAHITSFDVGNDNGHGLRGPICLSMLAIMGEHSTDANFTTDSRWQECLNTNEYYLRGYFNGTSEHDGYSYWIYGLRYWMPFVLATQTSYNASYLQEYNDQFCNIGRDMVRYDVTERDTYSGSQIRRLNYGEANPMATPDPQILVGFTYLCDDPVVQWSNLRNLQKSTTFNSYSSTTAIDMLFFNDALASTDPSGVLSNEWRDNRFDRAIWRDGWTRTEDLVFGIGGWNVMSYGHPGQTDNAVFLAANGYPLLSFSGYRNTTSEIPKDLKWSNTLVVDGKNRVSWSDFFTTTIQNYHYAGPIGADAPTPEQCTSVNFGSCTPLNTSYAMQFGTYSVGSTYNEVMGIKPYYTITNYTRRIVYNKDKDMKFFIEKIDVIDDTAHNYSMNYNTETTNIQVDNVNKYMNITRNTSKMQILTTYSNVGCSFRNNTEQYGIVNYNYPLVLNDMNCSSTANLTVINVWAILNTTETFPYGFVESDNSTHYVVNVTNSTGTWRQFAFSKSDIGQAASVNDVTEAPSGTPSIVVTITATNYGGKIRFNPTFSGTSVIATNVEPIGQAGGVGAYQVAVSGAACDLYAKRTVDQANVAIVGSLSSIFTPNVLLTSNDALIDNIAIGNHYVYLRANYTARENVQGGIIFSCT